MGEIINKIITRDKEDRYTIEILHEDDDIVVVNKPAGLLSIPDHWDKEKSHLRGVLESYLFKKNEKSKKNNTGEIFVIHRLDKDTSGIMIFAKNSESHKNLSLQFEQRMITKKYLAIVCGHPIPAEGVIDERIGKKLKKGGKKFIDPKKGSSSQTDYKMLKKYRNYSLIEAIPHTGRMHQIRVHLAHIGCPLAVDTVYSDPEKSGIEICDVKRRIKRNNDVKPKYIINRLTLHAAQIDFLHPVNSEKLSFSVLPPKDFSSLLKQLDKWNSNDDVF